MSMRVSLDGKYENAVVSRAEGINIAPVLNGESAGFPFSECEATWQFKIVVVIRRPRRKTGLRSVMNSNPGASEFNPKYPTGEPAEE